MINYLTGICQNQLESNQYLIMAGEIGFGVRTNLPLKVGQKVALYIHEHIREETYDLYGFNDFVIYQLFRQINNVSGVGPKLALAILNQGGIEEINQALENNDIDYFQNAPGVGKKMAQKLILELKSKIGQSTDLEAITSQTNQDLKKTLDSLGYRVNEYRSLLHQLPKELSTLEEQLKWILPKL